MTFKELLKKKDIHGAQLARRLGCHRSVVSNWCRGVNRPPLDTVPKIATVLGVTIEEVVVSLTREEKRYEEKKETV